MAVKDYGAIAFKNGKLITTDMFTPMIDMVGWEDTENDVRTQYYNQGKNLVPLKLKDNFMAYIGDKDCTVAFYKEQMVIVERFNDGTFSYHYTYFNCTNYKWYKWEDWIGLGAKKLTKIKVTKRNGYLVCKWKYKGDRYKVYFGYGVDLKYYNYCGIVNFYRSPEYVIKYQIPEWFSDKIFDFKMRYFNEKM